MSVNLVYICNRCDVQHVVPDTITEPAGKKLSDRWLPNGWEHLRNVIICSGCSSDLGAFLRGARIEFVAVDRTVTP